MTVEQLKGQVDPFRPFTICLDDGSEFPVPHADFINFLSAKAGENFVLIDQLRGIHLIDAGHVNRLSFSTNGR